jgi:hypothetical protein
LTTVIAALVTTDPRGIGNGSDDAGLLAERVERETREEQAKDRWTKAAASRSDATVLAQLKHREFICTLRGVFYFAFVNVNDTTAAAACIALESCLASKFRISPIEILNAAASLHD